MKKKSINRFYLHCKTGHGIVEGDMIPMTGHAVPVKGDDGVNGE